MSAFYTIVGATETAVTPVAEEHASDTTSHAAETTAAEETHVTPTDSTTENATTEAHTTEDASAHGEEAQGIAALGLSPAAIGAQLLTFLILFFVIKKYALSGIVKNLQKRHEDINRGLHLTAELDKQKAELDERVEEVLRAARKDANKVIAEAQTESSKIIQAAEETAGKKAEEIIHAAEGKIERDIAEARKGLRTEMASLVTEATEAILNQKLDANSDRKLVEDYLKGAMK